VTATESGRPLKPEARDRLKVFEVTDLSDADDVSFVPSTLWVKGSDSGWKSSAWLFWLQSEGAQSQEGYIHVNARQEDGSYHTYEGQGCIWLLQRYKCGGQVCGWRIVFDLPVPGSGDRIHLNIDQSKSWGATWTYDADTDSYTIRFDDAIVRDYHTWAPLGKVDFAFSVRRT